MTIQDKVSLGRYAYPSREESIGERDRLLVEAHLRDDCDAFSIIVDDHRPALLAQARRKLGPNGAAEDIVQETFERALKYIHRFGRSGDYRLGAWLNQILQNVVADHRQRQYREWEVAQASAAQVVPGPDVADEVGDPVIREQLNQAVLDLPPNQRAAFVMHEVDGLAYADVAKVLNITEDNARARVSRGKGQLRRTAANLWTAAGGLIAVPAGLHALQSRLSKSFHRDKGHVFGAGDRVATQISANPIAQSAINLVSTTPRGSFVFGIAATVATLGATTLVVAGTGGSTHPVLAAPAAQQRIAVTAPLPPPAAGPAASAAASGASTAGTTSFAWVNPGGSGATSGAAAAGFAAATCSSTNGVTPPGSGFSAGTPLGLANGEAVANTPAVDLSTVGPSLSFASAATITPYGSSIPTGSATLVSNVCLSSSGSWFTATMSGLPGPQVELQGTLQEVIGSGNDLGYVFRGTLNPSAASSGPLAGAVQFVVQVAVLEPANTAQLTVVFLGTSAETGPPNGTVPTPTTASGPTQTATSDSGTTAPADPSGAAPTMLPGSGSAAGSGQPGQDGTYQGGSTLTGSGGAGSSTPAILP